MMPLTTRRTSFKGNHDRAVPLRYFLESLALPGGRLYSLQKGPPAAELKTEKNCSAIDLAPVLGDFADAGAVVTELDFVIMTDSVVTHLAGAIGTSIWLLSNRSPYGLWRNEMKSSFLYNSMQNFKILSLNSWASLFNKISEKLMECQNG